MKISIIVLIAYAVWLCLASIISFMLFAKDKAMAKNNGNEVRIKEKTLLSITALGGALGSFVGRIVCHHKTDKSYFSLTIYVSLIAEILALAAIAMLALEVI